MKSVEQLKEEIEAIGWCDADGCDPYSLDVSLTERKDCYYLTVSNMYEYVNVRFEDLEQLSKIFGTRKINLRERSFEAGCETCDYGSSYEVHFTIIKQNSEER